MLDSENFQKGWDTLRQNLSFSMSQLNAKAVPQSLGILFSFWWKDNFREMCQISALSEL